VPEPETAGYHAGRNTRTARELRGISAEKDAIKSSKSG
jgi:hypothetical protein